MLGEHTSCVGTTWPRLTTCNETWAFCQIIAPKNTFNLCGLPEIRNGAIVRKF